MDVDSTSILLTRPRAASEAFAAALADAGVSCTTLISPLLEIVQTGQIPDMKGAKGVIFTSANAIQFVPVADIPAWCVGARTTAAAQAAGWQARQAGEDSEGLVRRILADAPDGPLIHLRGVHTRGEVAGRLTSAGIEVRDAVVYDQVAQGLNAEARALLSGRQDVVIPLFSPRTAALFSSEGPFAAPLHGVALSRNVADAAAGVQWCLMTIAQRPDADSMIEAILDLLPH